MTARNKVKVALIQAFRQYWHRDNVVGIDIGHRIKRGKHHNEQCIRFHIHEKRKRADLTKAECFPKTIAGMATDVIAATYYSKQGSPTAPPATTAIGDSNFSFGTLGALVMDRQSGAKCGLTCAHVLEASIHAGGTGPVFQPAPSIAGGGAKKIGVLGRHLWVDDMDAALIHLTDGVMPATPLPADLVIKQVTDVRLGMILEKYGARTGKTIARVEGEGRYEVVYQDRKLSFNAFRLLPLSNDAGQVTFAGDSGAIWIDPSNNSAVGLNFAGEDTPFPEDEYALALPMSRVLAALSISF